MRAAREYLGLTGGHFAKMLCVNPRTVRSWEQGRDPARGRIRPEAAELRVGTAMLCGTRSRPGRSGTRTHL